MTFKEQIQKIKDNWLFAIILIIVLVLLIGGDVIEMGSDSIAYSKNMAYDMDGSYRGGYTESTSAYYPGGGNGFAPEVEERKITTNSNLNIEVKNGEFYSVENKIQSISKLSDSIILSSYNNKHGTDKRSYISGSYTIKVPVDMYDSVVSQLQDLGEIKTFNENKNDITGTYTNIKIEIETEKERLKRYESMYAEATKISDKIDLNDRIFDQERKIKYLEDRLQNTDDRVDYSTISLSVSEKQPNYINVQLVKFSKLIRNLVDSFNSLVNLLFVALPWIALFIIGRFIYKFTNKKQNKKNK